ncbi:cuticle protein-like [Galendromus occidentalis]|uniref:Cuticle protein-like n=1 Tax=Galendromus occidentalis TaxID=34638 RepID=A0AAJ7SI62_9ACAR|nr:cuticle protein-like [Galendromus occidentalis]
MRAFQALCVALTAVACRAQVTTYGTSGYSLASVPTAVHTSYAPSVISTAPAIAVHSPAVTFAAAPVTKVAIAAAPVARVAVAAAPVARVSVAAAAAPAPAVRTHEIHTTSGRQAIRIEEVQAGDQVIRVHEAPQAGPQISQIRVPGEQHHVRVVNHQSGPAEVQRVVHRQQTQIFDVQKPGRAGARIVQVVRDESPAPTIEFVNTGGSNHHVYHANDASISHSSTLAVHAAPATFHVAAAPTVAIHSSPVLSVAHHAPITHSIVSAPSAVISGASYAKAIDNTILLHHKRA